MGGKTNMNSVLTYEGSNFLRQRLVLSCLSGKKVRIRCIRTAEENSGVKPYEMCLIRLIDQLSNGTKIEVGSTGTSFVFVPGVLLGGDITHICDPARGIGYYLEVAMMLAPFCKRPLKLTLKGITNCEGDPSVDQLRYSLLETLRKFVHPDSAVAGMSSSGARLGDDDALKLVVLRRGLPPVAGGVVEFCCPVRRELRAFQWLESGQVRKIRGLVFTRRVAPVVANRVLDAAKAHLNKFLPDVYVVVDNTKGPAPGYGITLNCLTTKGTYYSAESLSCQQFAPVSLNDDEDNSAAPAAVVTGRIKSPEEVGDEVVFRLLEEIRRGGCVDSFSQPLLLLFMVLGPKDVSKVMLGPLTTQAMYMLRHIRDFFSVTFKIEDYRPAATMDDSDDDDGGGGADALRRTGANKLVLTCVGTGFVNFSKGNI